MSPAELTAKQLIDRIYPFITRNQDRLDTQARTVVEESVRRLVTVHDPSVTKV